MGQNASTTLTTYLRNEVNIKQSVKVAMKSDAEVETVVVQNSISDVRLNDANICCAGLQEDTLKLCTQALLSTKMCEKGVSVSIAQNSKVKVSNKSTAQLSQDIKNQLSTKVKNEVNKAMEQINKASGYSLPGNNQKQKSNTDIINSINASLEQSITGESISKIRNSIFQNETSKLSLCGNISNDGSCNINLETLNEVYAVNVSELITNTLAGNSSAVALYNQATTSSKQVQEHFFASILNSTVGLVIAIGIVVAIMGFCAYEVYKVYSKDNDDDVDSHSDWNDDISSDLDSVPSKTHHGNHSSNKKTSSHKSDFVGSVLDTVNSMSPEDKAKLASFAMKAA